MFLQNQETAKVNKITEAEISDDELEQEFNSEDFVTLDEVGEFDEDEKPKTNLEDVKMEDEEQMEEEQEANEDQSEADEDEFENEEDDIKSEDSKDFVEELLEKSRKRVRFDENDQILNIDKKQKIESETEVTTPTPIVKEIPKTEPKTEVKLEVEFDPELPVGKLIN